MTTCVHIEQELFVLGRKETEAGPFLSDFRSNPDLPDGQNPALGEYSYRYFNQLLFHCILLYPLPTCYHCFDSSTKSSYELASIRELKPDTSERKTFDCFVAVDIDEISQHLVANTKDHSSSSPRLMKKIPSRKGSHGSGVEKEKSKTVAGEEHHGAGGPGWAEKSPLAVHVAIEGEAVGLPRAMAPTPDGARWRRVGARRPTSRWLDPSGLVIVFATLSCMGTLILLYLTLSMGMMKSDTWFAFLNALHFGLFYSSAGSQSLVVPDLVGNACCGRSVRDAFDPFLFNIEDRFWSTDQLSGPEEK
ncbi:hypothetical protein MUK42_33340 [Musa troglodytarum]|uniref:Uncharacterized protein n=1 Tax=Musa troglodytarum TaxID=320322 RepID=A0A9E7KUJ3_9LILI|nr:hypothetical protein MUK42_33340 [Musa troglodytarum]